MSRKKQDANQIQEDKLALISDVIWSVPRIYHRMAGVAEHIYGEYGLTTGKRGLLQDLLMRGPQTIADMVRVRPVVTRQYIQRLISELKKAGMVELRANPEDRRTKVVQLSSEGQRVLELLAPAERSLAELLAADHENTDLAAARKVMVKLVALLEDEEFWSRKRAV